MLRRPRVNAGECGKSRSSAMIWVNVVNSAMVVNATKDCPTYGTSHVANMKGLFTEVQPKEGGPMSSLSVFPPPPEGGKITMCEINARLIAESLNTAELSKYVPATQVNSKIKYNYF